MQPDELNKMSDVPQYVGDLSELWRHVDELQKEIKSIPDDSPYSEGYLSSTLWQCLTYALGKSIMKTASRTSKFLRAFLRT